MIWRVKWVYMEGVWGRKDEEEMMWFYSFVFSWKRFVCLYSFIDHFSGWLHSYSLFFSSTINSLLAYHLSSMDVLPSLLCSFITLMKNMFPCAVIIKVVFVLPPYNISWSMNCLKLCFVTICMERCFYSCTYAEV